MDEINNKKTTKQNIAYWSIEVLLGISFVALALLKGGVWFETNDDHFIMDLLIGQMTGKGDWHVSVCSPVFSVPISLLYRFIPYFPWYGTFFLSCHIVAVSVPLHFVGRKCKSLYGHILIYIIAFFAFLSSWYIQCRMQFTSTAEILAAAGFICLFMCEDKESLIWFAVLEVLGFSIRPEAMILIQPMGFAVLTGIYLLKDKKISHNIKLPIKALIISLGIMVLGMLLQKIVFSGAEWDKINDINTSRVELVDYYGCPQYQDVSDILKQYDVSEAEYNAFMHYMFPDYRKMGNSVVEIANYVKDKNNRFVSLGNILKWVYWDSYKDIYHGLNKVALCSLIFAVIAVIGSGKLRGLLEIVLYFVGKGISWGYIYYNGRMVNRVNLPLYLVEIVFFLCIGVLYLFRPIEKNEKKIKKTVGKICLVVLIPFFFFAYYVGRDQNREFSVYSSDYKLLSESEKQISNYCNNNLQNHYIISNTLFGNWKRSLWDTYGGVDNYIYAGGWFSYSPKVVAYVDEYLSNDNLFFITTEESVQDNLVYEFAYFNDVLNSNLEEYEKLKLSTGANVVIYRVIFK